MRTSPALLIIATVVLAAALLLVFAEARALRP